MEEETRSAEITMKRVQTCERTGHGLVENNARGMSAKEERKETLSWADSFFTKKRWRYGEEGDRNGRKLCILKTRKKNDQGGRCNSERETRKDHHPSKKKGSGKKHLIISVQGFTLLEEVREVLFKEHGRVLPWEDHQTEPGRNLGPFLLQKLLST